MLITKAMYADLCEGRVTEEELYDHLTDNFTLKAIVTDYIELLKQTKVNNTKITVDRQEMDAILSLFRVRGERTMINSEGNLEVTKEKRGRKPKESRFGL
jgi:hypothetical protein